MRAAVVDRYGPPEVARVVEVPDPTPGAGDVLVRVAAAAVTSGDARIRGARFPAGFAPFARLGLGLTRPRRRVLGLCFSGVVEAVGRDVTGFAVGDEVAGMSGARMGAHAELVAVPAGRVVAKPAGVSHEAAAGVLFGGTTALFYLRQAGVRAGASVLVAGASGAVGTNLVQLAKRLGATVTAVTSGANAGLVERLGADRVIDYTATDLATVPDRFDVVVDAVGSLGITGGGGLLAPGGVLVLGVAGLGETLRARGNVRAGAAPERAADFAELLALVAAGELEVVLDEVVPLAEIAAAYRRVDSGRKVGNVVVTP